MSWASREPGEPLEDWMLRLQISYAASAPRWQPGTAFMTVTGEPPGWVTFRHDLPREPYPTPGGPA